MKNYLSYTLGLLLMFGILMVPVCSAQTPTYTCTLANDIQTSDSVYEFDIYLLRTGDTQFEMSQIQFGFLYNDAIKNGGNLTASYVPWSVDTSIVISGQQNSSFNTATAGCIKIAAKLPTNGPGSGAIISNVSPGTRIGRLRLTNSIPFAGSIINVAWNFNTNPYPTKVFAYMAGQNTDITVSANHINSLANSPLPVQLSTFTSNVKDRNITLLWETKTELNAQKFEVDRELVPSAAWQKVGEIHAVGNSNVPQKYSYTDKLLNAGKYSYRLKMIDNTGAYQYTSVVEGVITGPKDYHISQNYPNPFNPSTKIDYQLPVDSKVVVDIYSITGQRVANLLNKVQPMGYYTIEVNAVSLGLSSGVYFCSVRAVSNDGKNEISAVKKMVLLK